MKNKLPEGWALTTLEELSYKISDGSHNPPKGQESGIPMLSAKNIQDNKIEFDDARLISEKDYQAEITRINISAGDVLLTIVGTIGRTAFVPEGLPKFSLQRSVAIIKPRIDGKFLAFWLRSPSVQLYLTDNAKGTAQRGIYLNSLKKVVLPLPPLAEQRRIVAKLDVTMQRVEASQARLEKLPRLLKKFRQAVLAAAVSGRLTETWRAENQTQETGADLLSRIRAERRAQWEQKQTAKMESKQLTISDSWKLKYEETAEPDTSEQPELPEGWAYIQLDNVAEMCLGKMLDSAKNQGTLQPYLGNINVRWGAFDLADLKEMRFTDSEDERYSVEKGDLVICEGGEPGRAAVWEFDDSVKIQKALHRVRPYVNILHSYFLYFSLRYDAESGRLKQYFTGTGIQHFTGKSLSRYSFPVPPITEQQEIVRQVNHYFALAQQLEERFEQAAAMVEQLPQALLTKAFSGQLVPRDPNDEPASVLLERLRNAPAPTKAKRVPKVSKSNLQLKFTVPQSLLEILTQHPDGISPEKLFSLAGFTDADVDAFYQELAKLQPQLEETKPINPDKNWPKTSSTLRLKSKSNAN